MRLLLDTHTFLWFINDNPKLSATALDLLESDHTVLLSTASLWEIAIKYSLGKLNLPSPYEDFITQQILRNDIDLLSIQIPHPAAVSRLPFHHRDPFDRMLIAQSIVEDVSLVSADTTLDAYPIKRLW
jgi:PIN domain nuclease of toxin-antitoxin system